MSGDESADGDSSTSSGSIVDPEETNEKSKDKLKQGATKILKTTTMIL